MGSNTSMGVYLYIYMVLYAYIIIDLYIYIGIVLFVYCFIACLKHSVLLSLYLYFILFLTSTSIFIIGVAVSLSFGFLRCKGMAVLSDTKHQAMPYSAKTFPECLPQMLHIWVFLKTFYRIVGCSDSWEPPFLNARKKAI